MRKIILKEFPSIVAVDDDNDPNRLQFELLEKTVAEISFMGSFIVHKKECKEVEDKYEAEIENFINKGRFIRIKKKGVLMGGITIKTAFMDSFSIKE